MNGEPKQNQDKTSNVNREDWNVDELNAESTNKPADETMREVLRGDATKGNADERDVAGSVDSDETPQGREEAKNQETQYDS